MAQLTKIHYCCVLDCDNNNETMKDIKMYKFPKCIERVEQWIKLIGRPELLSTDKLFLYRVCEAHFDGKMRKYKRLLPNAYPNINIPGQSNTNLARISNIMPSTSTDQNVDEPTTSNRTKIIYEIDDDVDVLELEKEDIKKLINKRLLPNESPEINLPGQSNINLAWTSNTLLSKFTDQNVDEPSTSIQTKTKMEIDDDDDVLELEKEIAEMESSTITLLTECKSGQVRFSRSKFMDTYESWNNQMKAKYQGYMYKKKFRSHCLNLYCKAPKAYPIFKTTFSLPSIKTLKNTKICLPSGINVNFINLVGKQIENIPKSKHVVVCLEEIPLKRHLYYDIRQDIIIGYNDINGPLEAADDAFVISIQGCLVNFQQMIGYRLVKKNSNYLDISNWIDDTIKSLFTVGLHVCAVVSKQTASLEKLANFKGISPDKPFFQVYKNKIYYIYDLAQMINAIRDSLMSCVFLYDNKMASWEHLQIFYETEMDRRIRLAPKLTPNHLKPGLKKNTQLQLTKDVFSETVAAAMSAEIDEERLPSEAQGTVEFFFMMNTFINLCNSTRINHPNKKKRAFRGVEYQTKSLLNTLMTFQNMKAIDRITGKDRTEETKCFNGIIISIKSILQMYQHFHSCGLKYLLTGRLHLKSEEMLRDPSQQRKGRRMTAIKLKRSFSTMALSHLIKNSTLSNYKAYLDRLILADEDANDFRLLEEYIPNAPKSSPLAVGTTDYRFELPVVAIFQRVCSYLLEKCASKHTCAIFNEYLDKNITLIANNRSKKVLKNKKLNADNQRKKVIKEHTVLPPPEFVAFLHKLEKIFIRDFDRIMVGPKLGLNLYKLFEEDYKPCPCFPSDYLKKLFLRIRIYNIVKFRNRRFKYSC